MTVDPKLICAEMRANELLGALQDACNGAPGWRQKTSALLRSIARYELPERATDALREVDARKRAAEILTDVCDG
jgi:hypothetical protein